MDSLTWIPAGERKPDAESDFVTVKLEDGSFSSAQWRHAQGDWLFGAHDRSGVVVAWSPPPRWHTCSQ